MEWLNQLITKIFCWIPRIWIVNPDESGIRITLGSRYCSTPPGWYVYWPLIQGVEKITVTPQVIDLRAQSVFTGDGRDLCFGGGIMYRVDDSVKAILEVQDYDKSLYTLALGIVTEYINQHEFKDCAISGIKKAILKGIREDAAGWGLKIMRMYITDFGTTRNLRVLTNQPIGMAVDELGDEE